MAIKVGGTTVVDDSRGLTNIATVDATTAAAISASGVGGGGTHDFVASGSIGAGKPVVLNSDGTVSVPQQTSQAIGSSQVYESNATPYQAAAFDSASNKVVVFFNENSLGYAVVGTVSGTSITFGSRVQFNDNDAYDLQAVYDDNEGKVVAAFRDDGNSRYGTVIAGTVSGSTITFGAKAVYRSQYLNESSIAYDSIDEKYLFGFSISGNYPRVLAGTLSGSTWTFGASVTITSTSAAIIQSVATSGSTFLYLYRDNGASGEGRAYVISLSGTTVSVGGSANFGTLYDGGELRLSYDSASLKVIVAYRNAANDGYCVTGQVTGTSVSFGTPAMFNDGNTSYVENAFDANAGKVVISFRNESSSNRGTLISGQVSGDTIIFDSPVVFHSSPTSHIASAFDSVSNKVVVAYNDDNPNDGTAIVFQNASTSLKSYNYVGLSGAAYADGATAEIKVVGSVNDQQSGLTGGQPYYVQSDGALSTSPDGALEVYAGLAISSTEILVKG